MSRRTHKLPRGEAATLEGGTVQAMASSFPSFAWECRIASFACRVAAWRCRLSKQRAPGRARKGV